MFAALIALVALGLGPPFMVGGGMDPAELQGSSFSWSFADRYSSFGFGSDSFGDWSYGEIRVREPLVDFPLPRTYSGGGGYVVGGAPLFEVPVRRGWGPRRQKFKIKIKNRAW